MRSFHGFQRVPEGLFIPRLPCGDWEVGMENRQVVFSWIQAGISQISSQSGPGMALSILGALRGSSAQLCPIPHKHPGVNANYPRVIPRS